MFQNAFFGQRVLVTGHTGFKGAWLSQWLLDLGAEVHGCALAPTTTPSLFDLLGLQDRMASHHIVDIRDAVAVQTVVTRIQPTIVFHLAAQPLVRMSYAEPVTTWATNVLGTIHVLEAIRAVKSVCACVVVTSDKCYENHEQIWGYRENDPMGGYDPYSSSKGATELAVASWRRSFFHDPTTTRIATARAGNVIGGGDWSADRIVVDFIRAIVAGETLCLRNPQATRPWQHVLEPLSGYLWLAAKLKDVDGQRFSEGWNFGPSDSNVWTVDALAKALITAWGAGRIYDGVKSESLHEAGLLKLDASKANARLNWLGVWDVPRTVEETVTWYKAWKEGGNNLRQLTQNQIACYTSDAQDRGLSWTK